MRNIKIRGGEMTAEIHEGGCLCGAVRYRVTGDQYLAGVCYCTFCQKRSGSPCATAAYFDDKSVEITSGTLKMYEYRSDESGRRLRTEFCPTCGSTVCWTAEFLPGMRAITGGTLDDPNWLRFTRHYWTRSAPHWIVYPPGADISATDQFEE
jgi:hypothetical protein